MAIKLPHRELPHRELPPSGTAMAIKLPHRELPPSGTAMAIEFLFPLNALFSALVPFCQEGFSQHSGMTGTLISASAYPNGDGYWLSSSNSVLDGFCSLFWIMLPSAFVTTVGVSHGCFV